MKRLVMVLLALLVGGMVSGCGGGVPRATLPANVSGDIAVLNLGADTSNLNVDQVALLQQTLDWMDRDLHNSLKRRGLTPTRINAEKDFSGKGHLLKITILDHKMIPKGARFLGGMMAGADRLNVHYDLVNASGKTVLSWDDVQGSTKGGTYVAQTLNRNAGEKIVNYLTAG